MRDLAGNNMYISIHCEPCERWNDIDPEPWIEDGVPDVDYVQAVLNLKNVELQGKSRFDLTMQNRRPDQIAFALFQPCFGCHVAVVLFHMR